MEQELDIAEEFEPGTQIHSLTPVALQMHKEPKNKSEKKAPRQNSVRCKKQMTSDEKECTFQPNIGQHKSRNLEQFLEGQRDFIEKKQQRLEQLKQQRNQQESLQLTCKPAIDSRSKKLANRIAEPVFSRLSRQKQHDFSVKVTQSLFQPQILGKSKSMYRQDNVSELLYSDAQRRIQKEKITARQSAKKRDTIPKVNYNTDRIVLRLIKQEFQDLTSNCDGASPIMALAILSQLFNIDLNPKKDPKTQGICSKVLKYITPSGFPRDSSDISLQRLWNFIEAILGKGSESDYSRQQQNQIYKNFGIFYRFRLTKPAKPTESEIPSFQPQILKSSERLAIRKRQRMLTEASAVLNQHNVKISVEDIKEIALADLYILDRMHKQHLYQQQKLEKESRQLQQCTFKPQITKREGPSSRQSLLSKPSICQKNLRKTYKLKTQTDNTLGTMNTQYSCQKERPSIKHSASRQHKIHEVRDIEKTVQRLSAGRKSRDFNRLLKERGYPKDITNWESYRSSEKRAVDKAHKALKGEIGPRAKAFIFDVHVGNGVTETIELKRGQSLKRTVTVIAQKYGFDENKKIKLLEMMKYHLKRYENSDKENHR